VIVNTKGTGLWQYTSPSIVNYTIVVYAEDMKIGEQYFTYVP
jgi:hypothetical protein